MLVKSYSKIKTENDGKAATPQHLGFNGIQGKFVRIKSLFPQMTPLFHYRAEDRRCKREGVLPV